MTRKEAKASTRAKLLAAAETLFSRDGYEAVGIRDIAREGGMSTGAVFANFKGKAELFEAAMGHTAPDVLGFLAKVIAAAEAERLHLLGSTGFLTDLGAEAQTLRRHMAGTA